MLEYSLTPQAPVKQIPSAILVLWFSRASGCSDAGISAELRLGEWVILLHLPGGRVREGTTKVYRQVTAEKHQAGDPLRFALVEIPEESAAAPLVVAGKSKIGN